MKLFILFLSLIFSFICHADKLVSCNDGDTCKIQTKKGVINVRLWGIDAPEYGQEKANESRDFLIKLLDGKDLTLVCVGRSYHRKVCKITFEKKEVSAEMVKAGWAWDYPQYSKNLYKKYEAEARAKKAGLWSGQTVTSPFCSRHANAKDCLAKKSLYQP